MRVAVTGATGMVGRATVRRLAERGEDVVALSRNPFDWTAEVGVHVAGRVTDYGVDDLRLAMRGIDAVIHLASMRKNRSADAVGFRPYQEANVQITENILQACDSAGIRSFFFASSIAVYFGSKQSPVNEIVPPYPTECYGLSKLCCEHLALMHKNVNSVCLRIAQMVGLDGARKDSMLMRFMALAKRKESLPLWGEGIAARDTIYVKDVVGAFECALDADGVSGVFNIGGERAVSNREVAETINEVFGNLGRLTFDRSRMEAPGSVFMDCTRAKRDLGWQREWGLRAALEDLKQQMASSEP